MFNDRVMTKVKQYFPDTVIAFKDQSVLMQWLGKLMSILAPSFMTSYTTTLGRTIYFPSQSYIDTHPLSSMAVLLHELTHRYDMSKWHTWWFSFLYIIPQVLSLFCIPLFWFHWYIALPVLLFFLLPLPAYFRMQFEYRGYVVQLYAKYVLNQKYGYNIDLDTQLDLIVQQFTGSAYYFAWPFGNLRTRLNADFAKIKDGQKPFDDPMFNIADDIMAQLDIAGQE